QCCTPSGTVVGFSSATYTGTETSGNVAVCIEILNPPSGGATKPFDAILLPAQSISDNPQLQQVECNTKFEFERGDSVKCHDCSIVQDNVCNMEENTTSLELILTVASTDTLGVSSSRSSTTIIVDDSREPECYARVGYEHTSYTISELTSTEEICVISLSPEIDPNFTINIATYTTPNAVDLFQPTSNILHFVSNSYKKCYETTFDFDVDNVCERFNCSAILLESTMTKVDDTAHVYINGSTASVVIALPERCMCTNEPTVSTLSVSNDSILLATTISSLVVAIIIMAVIVLIVLWYRKGKKISLDQFLPRSNQRGALGKVSTAISPCQLYT
ncbi:hypothetical protein GBAR_LOCUS4624, partial [Geodia barretti]